MTHVRLAVVLGIAFAAVSGQGAAAFAPLVPNADAKSIWSAGGPIHLIGGAPGPFKDPDAEVPYVPPRRVIAPPIYTQPGRVIFPKAPLPDGSFCSPPYDFCAPEFYDDFW